VDGTESQDDLYTRATKEFGAALDRLAYGYEADADLRRDLVQEIYLGLWRSLEKFNGRCSLRTWTHRVAHNTAASHVIRQSRKNRTEFLTLEEAESQAGGESIEAQADRQKSLARLLALIQRLEPSDRQLMLAYMEDMDAESIAEITGFSVANVWTKIHRIKNVLSRQFHKGGRDAG
jgi:RNA polymerase sigma-70 factor (ECF subfamily)